MARRNLPVVALVISLWLVVCLPTLTFAAAPNLLGLWKGTAPKITPQGCSNESVTINITHQCGNLISGSITFGSNHSEIAGRISQDVNISIHGFYSGNPIVSIQTSGQYVAGTTPQIIVDVSYFYDSSNYGNVEYDAFTLAR
ncbi:MAG: hypothetical protein KKD99_08680 [Proteobacteria bacterium]|nr:hypothetical protein [Pseudomonadota bacterium]MBU4354886.1 hypothetical protein [Pseudomonadota bacterium]MBU4448648.1 hypothetical protein [Pseudomonadota bacterium]